MPARVNVYCRRSVLGVTASALREEIASADLMTLAESLDLPEGEEAAVEAMWPHLRIDENLEIHWKPSGRAIQIDFVSGAEAGRHIARLIDDSLPPAESAGARRVLEHLAECTEIAYLELGIDDSFHLGATLAEVVAFYLARQGDGLVHFYHREWASPEDRAETLWTTTSPAGAPSFTPSSGRS